MTSVPGVPLCFGRKSSSPGPAACPCGGSAYRNIQWLSLNVLDCQNGGPLDQQGTVTFEARWRDRDRREGVLRGCSRFGRGQSGEWLYLEALSLGDKPAA